MNRILIFGAATFGWTNLCFASDVATEKGMKHEGPIDNKLKDNYYMLFADRTYFQLQF